MQDRYRVLLLMETSRMYGRSILRGIARYCRTHGPWVFLRRAPFYWGTSGTPESLKALRALGAHGMVLREQGERDQMLKLLSLGLPTIVSPYTEPFAGPPNILTDDAAIGTMAATYLLDRGFRHFAYCGFGDTYYWSRRRGVSFGDTIRAAGFDVHCYEYEQPGTKTPHSWEKEQAILTDWLRGLPQPVGLMACNDDRCQDILEACKSAGLHVPEQVAIVGVGNDDLVCDLAAPPLSSVALSAQKAGYEAAAILDRWMGGDRIVEDAIIVRPSRVVTRQSTDVFAVPDRQVVEALRFIHTHARKEAIQVDDVLRSVPISRRSLYDRFARTLGRSVHEEIKRVRVDELARLLVDTDLPMSQLALQLGDCDIKNLARYFKQSTGTTPLQYRHRHSPQ
jgi:LacI family transcriptional regulator